jgi:hypothetical protein
MTGFAPHLPGDVPDAPTHTASGAASWQIFPIVERYANRFGQILMATAGPFFWMALMFIAVAASLGWRLLIF